LANFRSQSSPTNIFNEALFERDVVPFVEAPQGGPTARNFPFPHDRNDFIQRHVWLLGGKAQEKFLMFLQRGDAATARQRRNGTGSIEALHPNDHHTGADPKAFSSFAA
jgi:hypothetical protein